MSTDPREILNNIFGYDAFKGPQEDIIQHLISGKNAFVLMPTGSGKSLCYQIPSIIRPGVGIVISPLVALMQDQISALRLLGVKAAAINSNISYQDNQETIRQMKEGVFDLVYVAPERLMTDEFLAVLKSINLALFAIDEAHCVSQWGHDFRPHYIQLAALSDLFPEIPRIALTATADEPTRKDIIDKLHLAAGKTFISGFDRPNIHYSILTKQNSKQQILEFIKDKYPNESGIIYCGTRAQAEEATLWFGSKGLNTLTYHAGMTSEQREENLKRFQTEDNIIMAATIAFGMGIDKPDVRFVAHLSLPRNIEAYYQETGRAGRDGLPAHALMLYGLNDIVLRRKFIEVSEADDNQKRIEHQKLNALTGLCEAACCRRQVILDYFGDQETKCGNCDNCDNPPETYDATIDAQKAMSCVYRTGQRFGVAYLIDVLQGAINDRISQFGHDQISTYGIGADLSKNEWKNIYRQLVAQNLLMVDIAAHGGLKLTLKGIQTLKTRQTIRLRKYQKPIKTSRGKAFKHAALPNPVDQKLFQDLRQKRLEIATELQVAPFIVFHDVTLREMATVKPQNMEQMAKIKGLGKRKLDAYGSIFLDVIHKRENIADIKCAS